ncbi:MAG: polymer-forming cytoskeletal protein [Candidatus Acetothermia bacterium]|jgi:cytoskeletal protein CcmA (bactofilin family)|nr:polymer-forming cytoskeletal protein [Candidatus Acetothermia bacterium]MDH7504971.1 polymer-forming cytoskeletal protein [Candidatus Acetothermia bacterium]
MAEERKNASISGAGKLSGGIYDTVKVAGSGKIEGDVDANQISTAGACKIEGNVKAQRMKTAGACKIVGDVQARELKTAGSCSVEGRVEAEALESAGAQTVLKSISAKQIDAAGSFRVGGDVEADRFSAKGSIDIGGLLSADEIHLELGGRSTIREIGGERIEVRKLSRGWHFIINLGGWGSSSLEAETIEGDEVRLEATRAKTVRGKRVVIGEDCRIDRVEYTESLQVDKAAAVKEQVKV